MAMTTRTTDGWAVVETTGRLDQTTGPQLEAELDRLVAAGTLRLMVDLSGVEFINSAGLRSIVAASKRLRRQKAELAFCGPAGMVAEVFDISGLSEMFTIYDSLNDSPAGGSD